MKRLALRFASLINNAKSWTLNKGEEDAIEKMEIQALKDLFDLPLHTPTPAIVFTFEHLFTKQRIDQKILLYLQKILHKDASNWLSRTLLTLKSMNIGWYKKVHKFSVSISFRKTLLLLHTNHPLIGQRW